MTAATIPLMAIPINIFNARLPGYEGLQKVSINSDGIIEQISLMDASINPVSASDLQVLDVAGDLLSLGGVDLQINGALGLAFPNLEVWHIEFLQKIGKFLWNQGIDAFLPTLVTTSVEKIQRSLAVLHDFLTSLNKGAKGQVAEIIGVHLEGPFLSKEKRGAHSADHLLPLTIDNVKRVLGDYAHIVKVITLAPELDTTGQVIPYLQSLGITVSLGHSQATAAQAQKAFNLGASMVTHAFNAMPSLHHREPGLLGAAIADPRVRCGLIADGQHVSPLMIQLLLNSTKFSHSNKAGKHRVFLVSDALAPLGLPDGTYPWDTRQIEVKNGTAKLPDGTLSGTTLGLLVGVQNLVKWGICDLETAIALATEAPRQAIGLPGISIGEPANLLRWQLDATTGELTWQRL